jgi:hypothetical protein
MNLNELPLMQACLVCKNCQHLVWEQPSWSLHKPKQCVKCQGPVYDDWRNINPGGTFEATSNHHQ